MGSFALLDGRVNDTLLVGSKELKSEKVVALFTRGLTELNCESGLGALAVMLLGSAWAATAAMASAEKTTVDLMNMAALDDVDRAS